ncbi:MAG: hypothetical protein QW704_00655 [Candidatus Hadarchaeales archaeon]
MKLVVKPAGEIKPNFEMLPSKLHTQLASSLAMLARGKVEIQSPLQVSDTRVILKILEDLGFLVKKNQSSWTIYPPDRLTLVKKSISVGGSATALAMISAALSLFQVSIVVSGDSSLRARRMSGLLSAFHKMGLDVHSTKKDETPPFIIFGGEVKGGRISLTAEEVRYLPALAIPACGTTEETVFQFPQKGAQPYVEPVLDVFGSARLRIESMREILSFPKQLVPGFTYTVKEELSSSAPFVILSLLGGEEVKTKLGKISGRDQIFLSALRKFGVKISQTKRSISIYPGKLKGTNLDISPIPELLPFFALFACFAKGRTIITGIEAAKQSKSNRAEAIFSGLRRMGAEVILYKDKLIVKGPCKLKGREVDGANDYAVTATLAVAGAFANGEVSITNGPEALKQAYPSFISTLKQMGVETSYI